MVRVVGDLKKLGLTDYSQKSITLELVDKFGKVISLSNSEFTFKNTKFSTVSDSDGLFTLDVHPNTDFSRETHYKTTIQNSDKSFNLYVDSDLEKVNILCLLSKIDYDDILTITDQIDGLTYKFDGNFIDKLEMYFSNENTKLTYSQRRFIEKFLSIADIPVDERCKDIRELDNYLANIGE